MGFGGEVGFSERLGVCNIGVLFFFVSFLPATGGDDELMANALDFIPERIETEAALGFHFEDLFAHMAVSDLVFDALMLGDCLEPFEDALQPLLVTFSQFEQVFMSEILSIGEIFLSVKLLKSQQAG